MSTPKETPTAGPQVHPALACQMEELRKIPMEQLHQRYLEVFGRKSPVPYRQHIVRRIAWKLQAIAHGDLSEAAVTRAHQIAKELHLGDSGVFSSSKLPSHRKKGRRKQRDNRQPAPGTELTRIYKDRRIVVRVNGSGFEYDGRLYRSLSAVARAATGTRWNGLVFFGLAKRGETLKRPKAAGKAARHAA